MIFLRLTTVLLLISLAGCKSANDRAYAEAMQKLTTINQSVLIAESTALLKTTDREKWEIPPASWPPTIKKLNPVEVRNYGGAYLCILLTKWASHDSGFIISADGDTPLGDFYIMKPIASRLFWYAL